MTKSPELRERLLSIADLAIAARLAQDEANRLNDYLNGLMLRRALDTGTSLLVRAMITRAIISTAAAWWAEDIHEGEIPEAETFAALRSFIDDPPPELFGEVVLDRGYR